MRGQNYRRSYKPRSNHRRKSKPKRKQNTSPLTLPKNGINPHLSNRWIPPKTNNHPPSIPKPRIRPTPKPSTPKPGIRLIPKPTKPPKPTPGIRLVIKNPSVVDVSYSDDDDDFSRISTSSHWDGDIGCGGPPSPHHHIPPSPPNIPKQLKIHQDTPENEQEMDIEQTGYKTYTLRSDDGSYYFGTRAPSGIITYEGVEFLKLI